ncbi:hypothetical protein R3P38DRAFT_3427744 [Favolaschia claudopus]|uniref:Uncharacterized protein n=1 Tax=Favolaschia claudopus TaxID=2862362 RepID=A0AAV9ZW07_9AGAR
MTSSNMREDRAPKRDHMSDKLLPSRHSVRSSHSGSSRLHFRPAHWVLTRAAASNLETTLNMGINDVKAAPPSATIEPVVLDALAEITAKKADFGALPITSSGLPALILQDLQNLKGDTDAFSRALIVNTPTNIDAGFASAIAAYS